MGFTLDTRGVLAHVAFCEAFGIVPGALTRDAFEEWYDDLEQPEATPPDWVFGPVWTLLYAMMGLSLYLVRRDRRRGRRPAVGLFVLQLLLNALWTMVFFGRRSTFGGLLVIALLLPAIALTVVAVARVNKLAAAVLVPYLLWSAFATKLNYEIWRLNR